MRVRACEEENGQKGLKVQRTRAGEERRWVLGALVDVGKFLGKLRLRRDIQEAWTQIPGGEEMLPSLYPGKGLIVFSGYAGLGVGRNQVWPGREWGWC